MEKQYNFQDIEAKIQQWWQEQQIYRFEPGSGVLYSIDTPPPTVSGQLHIGHIFSYTHTDFIARYKRMTGHAVFYPFGFDDNGLPTERYVEKKLNIYAPTMSRSAFINTCLQETIVVEEQFKELWQRMGLSVDWQLLYSTIAPNARKISQESFILLYKKGFIYRAFEPALYCTTCRTAVAQAELEDHEKTSLFNDIVFKTVGGKEIVIGTTRPEFLSSCVAVFYHPDDTRYQQLQGDHAIVPLFGDHVPLLADPHVDPEKGTGLVMCCTFGDKTDIEWFKKYNLPYKESIGVDGKFVSRTGMLAGLKVEQARQRALESLKEHGLLVGQRPITRAVNVHERCKKEIEYRTLHQWFLKILPYKEQLLQQAEKITWNPPFMKSRFINWVQNIGWDWCLSRQRFYGIPFPVWYCGKGHVVLAAEHMLPVDPQETAYPSACSTCGDTQLVPDADVMDTWNTSSLTPQICFSLFDIEQRSPFDADAIAEFLPMGMRPQAHDIIRTWAFYTIAKSWMHYDQIPWKDIVISGHVLSDAKEKLSKSKENNKIAPENLLKQYPADAIRYWTASARLGHDVAFSENQLKIGMRLLTKLWNASKFIAEHISHHEREPEHFGTVNEWILQQLLDCHASFTSYLNSYEFSLALDAVEKFFWHDFCDNYLELIKDQLFKPEQYDAAAVQATKWTLATVGYHILQLYAPYLPYITEEIYQLLYKDHHKISSIHQTQLIAIEYTFPASVQIMNIVNQIIANVRRLKSDAKLSLKTPLALLSIYIEDKQYGKQVALLEQVIKGVTQAATIEFVANPGSNALHIMQMPDASEQWHAQVSI